MTVDHVARPLSDGRYSATCRERTIVVATANGHRDVFPCAEMIVTDGWATFDLPRAEGQAAMRAELQRIGREVFLGNND
ncbi:hypothetical protein DF053_12430 [Burkholderia cepacia]|nr:hypothetical protein DF053_12430 [Burkholderia cepacia]